MGLFPRLRQACRRDHRGPADALQDQDSRLLLNRLFLSGVLVADPESDKGRDGEPVTLLLIAFPAPDANEAVERVETASCEVEVPEQVSVRHPSDLRAGGAIFVTGQLSGGGGILATEIHSGPPPGAECQ